MVCDHPEAGVRWVAFGGWMPVKWHEKTRVVQVQTGLLMTAFSENPGKYGIGIQMIPILTT